MLAQHERRLFKNHILPNEFNSQVKVRKKQSYSNLKASRALKILRAQDGDLQNHNLVS